MTTADYLESLQDDLNRTVTALELEDGTNFTDIANMAENGEIGTGGGADLSEYFKNTADDAAYLPKIVSALKKIPTSLSYNYANASYVFSNCTGLNVFPSHLNFSIYTSAGQMFQNCTSLIEVPSIDLSNVTGTTSMFNDCTSLTTVNPIITTSSLLHINSMFKGCTSLITIPILNTTNVTHIGDFVNGCPNLSNESLNNIMQMCINAVKITSNKTLRYVGLTSSQATTCQSLSNYQDFINAGWTTGY